MISDNETSELEATPGETTSGEIPQGEIPQDERWMREALTQAQHAWDLGEVPVGAVLVQEGVCIARAHNAPILHHDPTYHAEIAVLREAGRLQKNYRLPGTTLYVTLEPCMMCLGALVHARVSRVVFGAFDLKSGAVRSCAHLAEAPWLNHRCEILGGVLETECRDLLQAFFKSRR